MIYSKPCMHGLRAVIYIATRNVESPVRGEDIAREEDLPQPFLSKILKILSSRNVLHSVRGPGGGFRLARKAEEISLFDIVEAIDGVSQFDECALGWKTCQDDKPCPLHTSWKQMREGLREYLAKTSVAELVQHEKAQLAGR
ncbi:MAG: Rrf2 family transcriptional regulator [Fibrobacterota bacterium]|nr:Rrf2 family transcriptional regulator [Fibrobacterota bacterium]QQS05358.1 MAG: Rrf2 family transcriptional regulator [Fibrobacterota bacterium]